MSLHRVSFYLQYQREKVVCYNPQGNTHQAEMKMVTKGDIIMQEGEEQDTNTVLFQHQQYIKNDQRRKIKYFFLP